jgi:hypothetical protein
MSRLVLGNLNDEGAGSLLVAIARPLVKRFSKRKTRDAVEEAEIPDIKDIAPGVFSHPIPVVLDAKDTDDSDYDPVEDESNVMGLGLTFHGYDQLGAILIDSDGKRVEI